METEQAGDTGGTPEQRAALLSALVTEHFVVQSQRGVESSEAASRASLYLATLSGAMIALGFVSGTDHLAAFLGALIPIVFLLGVVTFARLVALEVQDFGWLRDIQRIRNYYRQLAPGAVTFFSELDLDDPRALVASLGLRPGPWQLLSTAAALIAVVNSAVGGVGAAVAASGLGLPAAGSIALGVAVAALMVLASLAWQWRRNVRALRTA
jgi:hypothetical protein